MSNAGRRRDTRLTGIWVSTNDEMEPQMKQLTSRQVIAWIMMAVLSLLIVTVLIYMWISAPS